MGLLDAEKYLPERATAGDPFGVKLREAIRDAGDAECPLCRVLENSEQARLHWLAYEGLADAGLRATLRRSRGFCPRHARMLYAAVADKTRNLSAIAQVQRELSAIEIETLTDARLGQGRRLRSSIGRLVAALRPATACPACVLAGDATARTAAALARDLAEPAGREAYARSAGSLCRPHFLETLNAAGDPDAATALIEKQVASLQRDVDDLDELLRKTDYRSASEPKGVEQQAPRRSLLRFIGTWPR